ncbi:MAG: hypothetical protein PF542_00675 [Nanoarchaeota archaeon]|nr:hypothetical protein [Nanoarchaeota archaeon]
MVHLYLAYLVFLEFLILNKISIPTISINIVNGIIAADIKCSINTLYLKSMDTLIFISNLLKNRIIEIINIPMKVVG